MRQLFPKGSQGIPRGFAVEKQVPAVLGKQLGGSLSDPVGSAGDQNSFHKTRSFRVDF